MPGHARFPAPPAPPRGRARRGVPAGVRQALLAAGAALGLCPGPGARFALAAAALCARAEEGRGPARATHARAVARRALVQLAGLRGWGLRAGLARFDRLLARQLARPPLAPGRAAGVLRRLSRRAGGVPAGAPAAAAALVEDVARADGRVSAAEQAIVDAARVLAAGPAGR